MANQPNQKPCAFKFCTQEATTMIFSDVYNREECVCDEHADRAVESGFWEYCQHT